MSERPIKFSIQKEDGMARAGTIKTPHGDILTPAFITVGTKATVKALSPEQVKEVGAQAVLANTYHLHLEPGENSLAKAGGIQKYMNWSGPTFTDSGGFQAFSLGAAYGKGVSKIAKEGDDVPIEEGLCPVAKVTEDGVSFKSYIDGDEKFLSPEKSIEIQHKIGADIIFAFDECTSPHAPKKYQQEALLRTHRWAKRCIDFHSSSDNAKTQGLFGIVQGGRFEDLRKESAEFMAAIDFDGYGVGGSFNKDDMGEAVRWVNEILPKEKPRHLLGIGEPADMIMGVENGCDTFDCVTPTRHGRNGTLYVRGGRLNILNSKFRDDNKPIEEGCDCYTCKNYSRGYIAHLFRAKEMFGATLCSIHNLRFLIRLGEEMRKAILDGRFKEFKENFLRSRFGG